MASCEKCWTDAYILARMRGVPQAEVYEELVEQRRDSPCSPRDQAGQWWDDETGRDTRFPLPKTVAGNQ